GTVIVTTVSERRSADLRGFHGRVLDADGAPVSRANVTLIDPGGRQAGLTTADDEGRYSLAAPAAGRYVLAGSATGHAPYAHPVTYLGGAVAVEVDLVLAPRAALRS
ncbi:carboxypeptidase-like regulatory domain-containing protein, partial [Streptomyces niveus]|uniref:carboxypeptidase-like regulatory domain-containing protein n=1 Tax=Streptomyces niveus TaxID=193462 RepID=UPI00342C51CC